MTTPIKNTEETEVTTRKTRNISSDKFHASYTLHNDKLGNIRIQQKAPTTIRNVDDLERMDIKRMEIDAVDLDELIALLNEVKSSLIVDQVGS